MKLDCIWKGVYTSFFFFISIMLMMQCDKDFDAMISQALLEVERDLFLPNYSLVVSTPSPKISRKVRLKKMEFCLDQNFMARVPEKLIRHSKKLVLHKRIAEQEETMSLLMMC